MKESAPALRRPIPYSRHWITSDDVEAVVGVLHSDWLTQGPKTAEFERAFSEYTGARYAVAVANGTAALHLAALALQVTPHTRVITTPITFAASANCIRYCGGTVAFADIDPATLLLDIDTVERLLRAAPAGSYEGIVVVDFAGRPVRLDRWRALADRYGLWIIEDACHAVGGYFLDESDAAQRCGNGRFADVSVFSFHPVKHLACGEGGMVTTNRSDLYERLLRYRTHGITKDAALLHQDQGGWYYEMQELGFNYRLTDMQAALGISQLKRVDAGLERRREIARRYDEAFGDTQVRTFPASSREAHAYHLYVVEVRNRREVYDGLRERQIHAQVHYVPLHTMPYYQTVGVEATPLNRAEAYYARALSLPMYPLLTEQEQMYVIGAVLALAG